MQKDHRQKAENEQTSMAERYKNGVLPRFTQKKRNSIWHTGKQALHSTNFWWTKAFLIDCICVFGAASNHVASELN